MAGPLRRVIFDSDILINYLKGREKLQGIVALAIRNRYGTTTAINWFEVLSGVRNDAERGHALAVLEALDFLPLSREAAVTAGTIDSDLMSRGIRIAPGDTLIAAIAIVNGLPLLTRNRRHFERVPGLELEEV